MKYVDVKLIREAAKMGKGLPLRRKKIFFGDLFFNLFKKLSWNGGGDKAFMAMSLIKYFFLWLP